MGLYVWGMLTCRGIRHGEILWRGFEIDIDVRSVLIISKRALRY